MTKLRACIVLLFCAAVSAQAQTFTVLVEFSGPNGAYASGPLIQGIDGNLYGATSQGGTYNDGTVFKLTPAGELTTLHSFTYESGYYPGAPLVQGRNGSVYGTTSQAGPGLNGTFFAINADGVFKRLYDFCVTCSPPSGANPGLVEDANGNFFGTSYFDGAKFFGDVFEITAAGDYVTLFSFCDDDYCTKSGSMPYGPLALATNGDFYGVTSGGGANNAGTVFEIEPPRKLTTLYSFSAGVPPSSGLIQAINGDFYGTTNSGGVNGQGSVFKITAAGSFATIYSFCSLPNCADGYKPVGDLLQGSDGNLYGMTSAGGSTNFGTIYRLNPQGHLTTIHNLIEGVGQPEGLMQDTSGLFYGTTGYGGSDYGTVFSLDGGLGAFVKTQTNTGRPGAQVIILGNNLTGSTAVSFNGTTAAFTVVSDTEATATVPAGATTGFVTVDTPSGTLKSNTKFGVLP
jgi:uncharacterized repeat protein (TIGR03803 family)